MSNPVSINMMIRNEPFAFFALAATAPLVDEVIVVDTGSNPEYIESLELAVKLWPHIKLIHKPITGDGHVWTMLDGNVSNVNEKAGQELGDIRREMHAMSKNNVIWLIDGDELYNNHFANRVVNELIPQFINQSHIHCYHLPVYDFLSKTQIRHKHCMGRLFKRDSTYIKSNYPYEMHHYKDPAGNLHCITPWHRTNVTINDTNGFVFHVESIVKPHRKSKTNAGSYQGEWPEVLREYQKGCGKLIEKYGF